MTWRRAVCASCAGPVDEGRCPTCRRARWEQRSSGPSVVPALWLMLAAVAAIVAAVMLSARGALA